MPIVTMKISSEGGVRTHSIEALSPTTFKDLGLQEEDVEEFVRNNPSVLFHEDGQSFLIVGKQVINELGDKADLIGVLPNGDMVIVEVKRDITDIRARHEPLEWQSIRYASSVATIHDADELIEKIFSRYLRRYDNPQELDDEELVRVAQERIEEFLEDLDPDSFNRRQLIVLVASGFDSRTLAACAWLVGNGVPLRCITLTPHKFRDEVLIEVETLLPPTELEAWLPKIGASTVKGRKSVGHSPTQDIRMRDLFDTGLLRAGDELYVKKSPESRARLLDPETVEFEGEGMSPTQWGLRVTGWSSFGIYQSAYLARTNAKLDALRHELLKRRRDSSAKSPE